MANVLPADIRSKRLFDEDEVRTHESSILDFILEESLRKFLLKIVTALKAADYLVIAVFVGVVHRREHENILDREILELSEILALCASFIATGVLFGICLRIRRDLIKRGRQIVKEHSQPYDALAPPPRVVPAAQTVVPAPNSEEIIDLGVNTLCRNRKAWKNVESLQHLTNTLYHKMAFAMNAESAQEYEAAVKCTGRVPHSA